MKKIILATAIAAVLPFGTAFAAQTGEADNTSVSTNSGAMSPMTKTHATQDPVAPSAAADNRQADMAIHRMFKRDAERLNLTPEQKEKIGKIMQEHKKDLDEDIRDELDDSQKATFDKIQAEHKAAWGKHKPAE